MIRPVARQSNASWKRRSQPLTVRRVLVQAFTLIELLVVISIIGLLISVLLPALKTARDSARTSQSLSNLRQIGVGMASYNTERKDYFPYMSSAPSGTGTNPVTGTLNERKPRWADYMFPYMPTEEIFKSPNLDLTTNTRMRNPWWHQVSTAQAESSIYNNVGSTLIAGLDVSNLKLWGGYGMNFQYLGNSRVGTYAGYKSQNGRGWNGRIEDDVKNPAKTILVGDTHGALDTAAYQTKWWTQISGSSAVYTLDSPLGSLTLGCGGNGRNPAGGAYYPNNANNDFGQLWSTPSNWNTHAVRVSDDDPNWKYRSLPALRNQGGAAMVWADGHANNNTLAALDDSDGDGFVDNGNWNGIGSAVAR